MGDYDRKPDTETEPELDVRHTPAGWDLEGYGGPPN